MDDDPLGWLLPEAGAEERAALRRVLTGLRLLRDDARAGASRVEPSWTRARGELDRAQGLRRRRALEALVSAYLQALRPAHSFLELGPRVPECSRAWRTLLACEASDGSLLPRPAEAPEAVLLRLLDAARLGGAPSGWCELWHARLRHLCAPGEERERRWEALVTRAETARARPPYLALLLAGWLAARLERGQPERALALQGPYAPLAALDPTLRRLLGWSALLAGELERARALLVAVAPARLPSPMAELRADVPVWAGLLPGEPEESGSDPPSALRLSREALGVRLVAVFACTAAGGTTLLALDAPAAVRTELERSLAASPACVDGALVAGPLRSRRLAPAQASLAHALGGVRTRALARIGVRDPAGTLAGWLQLESESLALPCSAQLELLAEAWRAELLARRGPRAPAEPRAATTRVEPFSAEDPRVEFVEELQARLAPLCAGRAGWLELAPDGALLERCAPATPALRALGPEAARTVWARATVVRTDAQAPWVAFGLPLVAAHGARVLGVLCCALAQGPELEGRLGEVRARLEALAPLWWATAFRAAWRAHEGIELAWNPGARFLAGLEPALRGADPSLPVLIVGPHGSGRRTLARWRHFRAAEPRAGLEPARTHELESLEPEAQRALARVDGSFCLLADAPVPELRAQGRLERELERRLDPLPLFVPPLAERRDEIPALVRALAAGAARAHGGSAPRFDDAALGALWRQDWKGQVSELAALVAQLVRAHGGGTLGPAEVRAALHSRGLAFRARISSAGPRGLDLELALACTRHRNGHENHARAARYLGWDPETLAARLAGRAHRRARARAARAHPGGPGTE